MEWISPSSWERYYKVAEQYYKAHGDLEMQPDYVSSEGVWLGRWIAGQRLAKNKGSMPKEHIQKLNRLSMRWTNKNDERWDRMLLDLTDWIADHTDTSLMPSDTRTKDGTNLYMWARRQQYKSAKGELLPHQQLKWDAFVRDLYYQRIR